MEIKIIVSYGKDPFISIDGSKSTLEVVSSPSMGRIINNYLIKKVKAIDSAYQEIQYDQKNDIDPWRPMNNMDAKKFINILKQEDSK